MRLTTAVLAGCLSAGLFAAEPAKPNEETLARELVAIFQESGDQRSFANAYDAVMPILLESFVEKCDERVQQRFEDQAGKLVQLFESKETTSQIADQFFVPSLQKEFTAAELQQMISFYKTPLGKRSAGLLRQLDSAIGVLSVDLLHEEIQKIVEGEQAAETSDVAASKRSMADIRAMATASEAYATDANHYPDARSLDELEKIISPTYIRRLPRTDGWGTEVLYRVSPDLMHYRFVSAGSDRQFDLLSDRIDLSEQDPEDSLRKGSDYATDIIYQDGAFLQIGPLPDDYE